MLFMKNVLKNIFDDPWTFAAMDDLLMLTKKLQNTGKVKTADKH